MWGPTDRVCRARGLGRVLSHRQGVMALIRQGDGLRRSCAVCEGYQRLGRARPSRNMQSTTPPAPRQDPQSIRFLSYTIMLLFCASASPVFRPFRGAESWPIMVLLVVNGGRFGVFHKAVPSRGTPPRVQRTIQSSKKYGLECSLDTPFRTQLIRYLNPN